MTATTTLPRESSGLSFGGIVRSEWIKLTTLRSTMWCYVILIVLNIGLGLLIASVASTEIAGGGSRENIQALWLQAATLGLGFSQLVAVVLGALVITGEYGTGMIRSTFAAVPGRLSAVFAKALVFGIVTFVVGLVSIVTTALLTAPLMSGRGLAPDISDPDAWIGMLGGAGYLALIGILALAIGVIIRNSAGAIATGLGLVLVVPTVLQILAGVTQTAWAQNLSAVLPSVAGGRMYAYGSDPVTASLAADQGYLFLDPWQGGLVLLAWIAVISFLAAVLVKSRDT